MLGLSHFGFLFSNMITIIHTLTTLFRNETCKGKWSFFNKPEKDAGQSNYFTARPTLQSHGLRWLCIFLSLLSFLCY